MELLLCEPEDRLGSQGGSAGSRPNSYIMQARRSGFIATYGSSGSVDGAEHIKVGLLVRRMSEPYIHRISQAHPWFRNIDWNNIHQQQPPFRPELQDPEDTRYFDQDIPAEV
jgi:protein-serine/threonine kinase